MSCSANAGHPVFQRQQCLSRTAAAYWIARSSRAMTALLGLLLRRLLRDGRLGAGDGGAAHVARLRLIVAADPVHGLAIVPHHEIMQLPFVDVDELRLRRVLGEVAQQ